jgi:hypothetical protein
VWRIFVGDHRGRRYGIMGGKAKCDHGGRPYRTAAIAPYYEGWQGSADIGIRANTATIPQSFPYIPIYAAWPGGNRERTDKVSTLG